jgi:hypothetical protein
MKVGVLPGPSEVEGPALSEVEGPVLSEVEGPVLSEVEGSASEGPAPGLAPQTKVRADQDGWNGQLPDSASGECLAREVGSATTHGHCCWRCGAGVGTRRSVPSRSRSARSVSSVKSAHNAVREPALRSTPKRRADLSAESFKALLCVLCALCGSMHLHLVSAVDRRGRRGRRGRQKEPNAR